MRRIMPVFLLLALVGCHNRRPSGETMIVGFAAPEYAGKQIHNILIAAREGDIYFRDQLERRMVTSIEQDSGKQTQARTYLQMFPPIRDYPQQDIDEQIKRAGVDAVMFINVTGSDVNTSSGWGFSVGNYGGSGGSYARSARFTRAIIEVYDPSNHKIMWKAEGDLRVKGSSQKSFDNTASNLARTIAGLLRRDGFYPGLPTKKSAAH